MKTDSFALRHLGPRENDLPKMLNTIGVETLDQLIFETIGVSGLIVIIYYLLDYILILELT